jgi:hypothetical protein
VHALDAALGGEYLPSIHEIQEIIPRPELYVPAAQEVQKEWPPEKLLYTPVPQFMHVLLVVIPLPVLYFPPAHTEHAETPEPVLYVPLAHFSHAEPAYWPITHGPMHDVAAADDVKVPLAQVRHAIDLTTVEYWPVGQFVQLDPLLTGGTICDVYVMVHPKLINEASDVHFICAIPEVMTKVQGIS